MAKRTKDEFTRDWIIENSVEILSRYEPGVLTIRALHYQLVSIGMTNTLQHYKRVVAAMEVARWDGRVDFEAFSDRDRAMCGYTHAEPTKFGAIIYANRIRTVANHTRWIYKLRNLSRSGGLNRRRLEC